MVDGSTAWWILLLALVTGILHIQVEYAGAQRRVYIFKPLTTSLIIVFALLIIPPVSGTYKALILAGLCFSLAGDVFLMLPDDRFVAGLVSFLIAHLLYIAAFVSLGGFQLDGFAFLIYFAYGTVMLSRLWPGLGSLRLPVLLYMAVILVMGWQALALWRTAPSVGALSVAIGAALFVLSDSVLAYGRFRRPFPAERAVVLSTYYVAQALIAVSVAG